MPKASGLEITRIGDGGTATFYGPITDVQMHPRIFDPRVKPFMRDLRNGKAGLEIYTQMALRSGIVQGLAMPNESLRLPKNDNPDKTELVSFPLNNSDRLVATASKIIDLSMIPMGIIFGVDPKIIGLGKNKENPHFTTELIEQEFSTNYVHRLSFALKIYAGETEGGYTIPLDTIMPVANVWHKHNPRKPVIMHLEDGDVGQVLDNWPADIPAHIAHVSSQQELEAVIIAKENGKDVTCEATPHHMFLTDATREALGPYGCMKPTLKSKSDRKFLWDNMEYIDIFASDCAPHRHADKVGFDGKGIDNPSFGVANHSVFVRAYLQAIAEGRLTEDQLFSRIVTNPIKRFQLPQNASTTVEFDFSSIDPKIAEGNREYGCSPFVDTPESVRLRGKLTVAKLGGRPAVKGASVSRRSDYSNLMTYY